MGEGRWEKECEEGEREWGKETRKEMGEGTGEREKEERRESLNILGSYAEFAKHVATFLALLQALATRRSCAKAT